MRIDQLRAVGVQLSELERRKAVAVRPAWSERRLGSATARHPLPLLGWRLALLAAGSGWRAALWRRGRAAQSPLRGCGTGAGLGQKARRRALAASRHASSCS